MKINELMEATPNPKKYLNPMFEKWKEMLDRAVKAGVNIEDSQKQKELLAHVIGNYARLSKEQITQLHSRITSANLEDDNQVKEIMIQAISQTLLNRGVPLNVLEPGQKTTDTPPTKPAKASPPAARTALRTGTIRTASDRQKYRIVRLKDKSREWWDLGGNRAPDNIQKELRDKYGL